MYRLLKAKRHTKKYGSAMKQQEDKKKKFDFLTIKGKIKQFERARIIFVHVTPKKYVLNTLASRK